MKARLPQGMGGGGGNRSIMLREAQQMPGEIQKVQQGLEAREYTTTAGGGVIEVTVDGKHQVKAIGINPEVVDPEEVDMLEDLLVAALNEAMREVDETTESEMSKVTGGLNIPGL
ncbi:MAG: YbaB/EbfC family nucleoid-associated protein [Clostridiales bacterium]|nr:YbaB/EbfC family nucleoid-associated protein [Clostridiales bacterium]